MGNTIKGRWSPRKLNRRLFSIPQRNHLLDSPGFSPFPAPIITFPGSYGVDSYGYPALALMITACRSRLFGSWEYMTPLIFAGIMSWQPTAMGISSSLNPFSFQ